MRFPYTDMVTTQLFRLRKIQQSLYSEDLRLSKFAMVVHAMSVSNLTMQKKRGRPSTGQDPVLSVRMHQLYLETIDEWRLTEPDKPSRSEALRFIIAKGLEAAYNERKK
jgi:hypothetical protein